MSMRLFLHRTGPEDPQHHITAHWASLLEAAIEQRVIAHPAKVRYAVDKQAEDPGLWSPARTSREAYLQAALRNLHATIEGTA